MKNITNLFFSLNVFIISILRLFFAWLLRLTFRAILSLLFLLLINFGVLTCVKQRTLINESQIFENKILIKLFSDDVNEIRLEFFIFDELIEENDALGNDSKLTFLGLRAKDDVRDIEYDPDAVVVFFIEI
jgi:hypothetical protein